MKNLLITLLTAATCGVTYGHGHINAGATDTNSSGGINAGDRLFMYFETGTQTTELAYNSGAEAYGADGFLWNGYTTMTALHQSSFPEFAPDYNSFGAMSGSFLRIQLDSVAGPAGAQLAFYDAAGTDPLWIYEIGTGFVLGDGFFDLTEEAWFEGVPEDDVPSDPFGHIHGRMFGVDTDGTYTATWKLVDRESSTTGLIESQPFNSTFTAAAVPEPGTVFLLAAAGAVAAFICRRKA